MAFQRGDVVLIPFPYTDLSTSKTRPAVVVSSEKTRPTSHTANRVLLTDTYLKQDTSHQCSVIGVQLSLLTTND